MASVSPLGSVRLYYFDIPKGISGRGGAIRFFLLRRGLPFEDDSFPMAEWTDRKEALLKSGDNPTGHVPVVYQDGKPLTETHAVLRKFSRQLGEYGSDADQDYVADRLASIIVDWHEEVVAGIYGDGGAHKGYPDGDEAAKSRYRDEQRPKWYSVLEGLVSAAGGSASNVLPTGPSFIDDLLFGQLWDDGCGFGFDDKPSAPRLKRFMEAYRAQPSVAEWCDQAAAAAGGL